MVTNAEQFRIDILQHFGPKDFKEMYRGRYFYEGPGFITGDVQGAIRAISVEVQTDELGLQTIVYPKNPMGEFRSSDKPDDWGEIPLNISRG